MWRGLAALALMGLVAACGPFCNPPNQPAESSLHMVFTGPAPGTLTAGNVDCHLLADGKQFNAAITGNLGGKEVLFNIQVYSTYKGPATYLIGTTLDGEANLRLQIGDWVGSSPSNAGQLIIADERSGVVDANLGGFEHVTGNFRCPEVKKG